MLNDTMLKIVGVACVIASVSATKDVHYTQNISNLVQNVFILVPTDSPSTGSGRTGKSIEKKNRSS
jgi:hypothetical protein